MKPYLLVSARFNQTGGQDRANLALAEYLADLGKEVHLVGYAASSELLLRPNVNFHKVPRVCDSDLLSEPLTDLVGRFWAIRIERRGGRVIVNGANCMYGDINWVHYVHASDSVRPAEAGKPTIKQIVAHNYFKWRERAIIPQARVIIAHSYQAKRDLIEFYGLKDEIITVLPLGIDTKLFHPVSERESQSHRAVWHLPANRLLACFIGGFCGVRKGFDLLFEAWRQLCSDPNWDVDLVAVGPGPELPFWQDKARSSALEKRIHFLGKCELVHSVLKSCNVYVLPSRYETYSLSTQEALCCGLPAFISASTGIAEQYPEKLRNLLIPNPENIGDLVSRLRHWRENINYYRELVAPFTQQINKYDWTRMAECIMTVIEST